MAVTLNDTGITFSDGSKQAVSVGRNKIINGAMNIAQRGTSFAAAVSPTFFVDRFAMDQSSAAVVTASQQIDAPANKEFVYSARIAVTTADASIAAGDYFQIYQAIEGYSARDLVGKTLTLSFWVRSSKTGTHCVAFVNSAVDKTYVAEYIISAANTWEYKTITLSGGLLNSASWNWTNGTGVRIRWALASGSTYHTTAGAWQTGNFLATSNQVNCLDTVGNIFAITGVQLEVGAVATPFEHRPYGAELALCQRYYTTSEIALGNAVGTQTADVVFNFKQEMRTVPTVTQVYSGVNLRVNGSTSNIGITATAISSNTRSSNVQIVRTSGTWTVGNAVVVSEQGVCSFNAEF